MIAAYAIKRCHRFAMVLSLPTRGYMTEYGDADRALASWLIQFSFKRSKVRCVCTAIAFAC